MPRAAGFRIIERNRLLEYLGKHPDIPEYVLYGPGNKSAGALSFAFHGRGRRP
jgi:hypothetical protein